MLDKLLYADDLAENAKSEAKLQGAVNCMSKAVQGVIILECQKSCGCCCACCTGSGWYFGNATG